jgi:sigma-B regulation protein RsbU (phosphoserine phosphatase)
MGASRRLRIAVLLDHIESEYPITILIGIARAAHMSHAQVFIFLGGWLPAPSQPPVVRNFLYDFIRDAGFDGIIALAGSLSNYCGVEAFRTWLARFAGIPLVTLGLPIEGIPSVYADNGVGTYAAVSHLIDTHTCRRLAFIAGPEKSTESNARLRAYKQALEDHGIPTDARLIVHSGGLGREGGIAGVTTLFDERRFTPATLNGIIAVNDDVAFGAMEALGRRGIGVPYPIAVVGFDDTKNAASANPPLTTVNQRVELQGYTAARALLGHIEGTPLADEKLEPDLVVRASCGCAAAPHQTPRSLTPPKNLAKNCRLALIERRSTFLAEVSRAAAGRLSGAPGWEASLLDALGAELDGTDRGKFVRQLERMVRQNALDQDQDQLKACHDVLTIMRSQALHCAALDPPAIPLLEELFQESRLMVARVSSDVQRELRQSANLHLRIVTKSCMSMAAGATMSDLDAALREHLPSLGIGAFSVARFKQPGAPAASEIVAHSSRGLMREPTSAVAAFEVGQDPSLEGESMIVIEPLEFASQPQGVAALRWGAFDPLVYEQLREMLGMAIYVGRGRA